MGEQTQGRAAIDADTCGGRPHIRGTRIEIAIILDGLAEGLAPEQLVDHYPQLTIEDIRAALSYAAELSRESVYRLATV